MSTSTPPNTAQQQQYEQSAQVYETVYAKEQQVYNEMEQTASTMTSFAGLANFFGELATYTMLVAATQACILMCASALGNILQGIVNDYSSMVNTITSDSQTFWDNHKDQSNPNAPTITLSELEEGGTYYSYEETAQGMLDLMQDLYSDVGGYGLENGVPNPFASIAGSVQDTLQDFMFQINETTNDVINGQTYSDPGSYEENGNGADNIYSTGNLDQPTSGSYQGITSADSIVIAMTQWYWIGASEIIYGSSSSQFSNPTYTPTMSNDVGSYTALTDLQTLDTDFAGVSQQVLPDVTFFVNVSKEALGALYTNFSKISSLNMTIINNK
jgi:hypothetical protein